ncbi:MAG: DUF2341 domain-containing protein [Gammaproteobacteria bacterium HGW-Gammaproteobacteria-10]|nr:MAG: DUF2341 domain-containing protein [Gammaproteobacteria bacterium HGW-Gammaproteobacteria-10]
MKRFGFLLFFLMLMPQMASAWWNADWSYKKKIDLDLKQSGVSVPEDAVALIRLHTGNFSYFMDIADLGKDIRFMAGDDKTPLKFYIEKLDSINEMALIWVKLPKDVAKAPEPTLYMYYSNPLAPDGQDAGGVFPVDQVLSLPFTKDGVADMTAYANHPSEATAAAGEGGLIGHAGVFEGEQIVRIPASASLLTMPDPGWTLSAWLKIDQPNEDGVIFQRTGATGSLTFYVREQTANLELADASGGVQTFPVSTSLTPGSWHHFAAIVTADRVVIYLDGAEAGSFSVIVPGLEGDITIGSDAYGARGLIGAIDQLNVYKSPRSAEAIKFDALMQGQASPLLVYGEDLSPDSEGGGGSHVLSTMQHVSLDGWIIIGILAVMLVISFLVMAAKALVLIKNHKENRNFEDEFMKLKTAELEALNHEDTEDDEAVNASPLLASLTGGHERFTGSSVYRLYHVGIEELHNRLAKSVGADVAEAVVSEKGMDSIRAAMESCLIRETQKLNSLMVLLTISISGGPFLGLLGTVIGVMATFGEIAASGEVNVNAIAPGIAAALATTVAGLVVAIPCLFGYNYLNSRIKLITADMYIFVDEFTAKLSERYSS